MGPPFSLTNKVCNNSLPKPSKIPSHSLLYRLFHSLYSVPFTHGQYRDTQWEMLGNWVWGGVREEKRGESGVRGGPGDGIKKFSSSFVWVCVRLYVEPVQWNFLYTHACSLNSFVGSCILSYFFYFSYIYETEETHIVGAKINQRPDCCVTKVVTTKVIVQFPQQICTIENLFCVAIYSLLRYHLFMQFP